MRRIFLCLLFLFIYASYASAAAVTVHAPASCEEGDKISLNAYVAVPLPASSFYRVNLYCPKKPDNARIRAEMGYPASDLVFDTAGDYECELEIGILSKSSCAGVQYRPIGKGEFKINVTGKIAFK